MKRFAIVGAGSISREFAMKHITPSVGAEVVAIVDLNLELAKQLANDVVLARLGAPVIGGKYRETVDSEAFLREHGFSSIPELMVSSDINDVLPLVEAVYIGTPPLTHARLATLALAAGKHVLLEKPISVSSEDSDVIVAAADEAWRRSRIVLALNIGMRYNAAVHELKALLSQGFLGEIANLSLRLLFRQWPREWQVQPWVAGRAQGGPLLEVGTHWIFAILEILGFESFVSAENITVLYDPLDERQERCEVSCSGYLQFQRGVKVDVDIQTVSNEASAACKDIYELHVNGTNGNTLLLYDFTSLKTISRDGGSNVPCCRDVVSGASYGRVDCVQALLRAAETGKPEVANLVTASEARAVERIISSMKSRRQFVNA